MKNITTIIIIALLAIHTAPLTLHAAFPLRWNVETSRVQPAQFDVYRGETLDLEASFQSYGKPLAVTGPAALYYQTNGMGAAWWTAPATVASNTISASFAPSLDPGAPILNCFLGGTSSNYRAAFRLRYLNSPGATPNLLPLPIVTYDARLNGAPTINGTNLIDFVIAASGAEVDPTVPDWAKQPNPPQSGTDEATVKAIINAEVGGTNNLAHGGPYLAADGRAAEAWRIGDGDTWTDATGCVWRVDHSRSFYFFDDTWLPVSSTRWEATKFPVYLEHDGQKWTLELGSSGYFTNSLSFEQGNFTVYVDKSHYYNDSIPDYYNIPIPPLYEMVGRVALTNDIPATPSDIGAAPASVVDDISVAKMWSMGVYQYMLGQTNAWAAFTNYPPDRATYESKFHYSPEDGVDYSDVPSSMQLYEIRGGETNTVYDSRSWPAWYYRHKERQMLDRLADISNRVPARGWAKYHAHAGTDVPSPDMTIIDTPYLVLQGGYEWEKTVTAHGTIWTIVSNGLTADFNSMENATNGSFFAIRDLEGNDVFSIRNKQSVMASAVHNSVSTSIDPSGHTVVTVNYTCDYEPIPGAALDLIPVGGGCSFFYKNNDPDCPAHITVSGSKPNWTVTAVAKGIGYPYDRMFIAAAYEQPGENVVKSGYPFDISGGFLYNGVRILPVTNADHTVTWRWQ